MKASSLLHPRDQIVATMERIYGQAVVNAVPLNGTAFCVSDFPLDTRTIPESFLFLKDMGEGVIQELLGAFPGV
jgi:hypothetical protein